MIKGLIALILKLIQLKPYFGKILHANQVNKEREVAMKQVLKEKLHKNFTMIEIGSWMGSSTAVWGDIIKRYGWGKIYCVDSWSSESIPYMKKWGRLAYLLFRYNIWVLGLKDHIVVLKGNSDKVLPNLKSNSFDLVYIDGDHRYSQVKKDIENAKRLVKGDGVICGDDLEYQLGDCNVLMLNREQDNFKFHVGVSCAVAEAFERIENKAGFWIYKKGAANGAQ